MTVDTHDLLDTIPPEKLHPDSPLGRLYQAIRGLPDDRPTREHYRQLEAEKSQLEAWLKSVTVDTDEDEYNRKWARLQILEKGLPRVAQQSLHRIQDEETRRERFSDEYRLYLRNLGFLRSKNAFLYSSETEARRKEVLQAITPPTVSARV